MGAKSVHHTATTDTPWDGPAAVAAMPNDAATLWYCHAWRDDDGEPDAKSSYKDPHHERNGGPANLAACRNGLARLSGTDIPEADKDGVKKHLQAHLDDAKSEDRARRVPVGLTNVAWPKAVVRAHSGVSPVTGRGPAGDSKHPWAIRDAADAAEILLYDEIGGWGVYAEDFARDLAEITAPEIVVRVNSPGGDVFDGIAIMNALIAHPANVTIRVDGLAASIASVICLAGNRVVMGHSAQMMIHNASTMAWGTAPELRQTADLLEQISGVIAQAYADRSGTPVEEWSARMDAETWLTAQDCVKLGLADEAAPLPPRIEPEPVGVDPDPDNRVRPPAGLRPAARLDDSTTPTDVVVPVDASDAGVDASVGSVTAPDEDPPDDPDGADGADGGHDTALVGQILGWALAIDQHVDRLIAECASALGIDNPDVDNDGEPPPLPTGDAGLAYALGILTSIDTVVDGAQVILAKALGIENPDPDEDDDEEPEPRQPVKPGTPTGATTDTPSTGATAHINPADTWTEITNNLFPAACTDPVLAALEGAMK